MPFHCDVLFHFVRCWLIIEKYNELSFSIAAQSSKYFMNGWRALINAYNRATESIDFSRYMVVQGESLGRESLFLTIAQYSRLKNRKVGMNHPSAILLHHLVM